MKFADQLRGPHLECFGNINEFNDAQTALSALIFGDEGLRFAQTLSKLGLSDTTGRALPEKQLAQLDLSRRAQGVAHGRGQLELMRPQEIIPFPDYPILG